MTLHDQAIRLINANENWWFKFHVMVKHPREFWWTLDHCPDCVRVAMEHLEGLETAEAV